MMQLRYLAGLAQTTDLSGPGVQDAEYGFLIMFMHAQRVKSNRPRLRIA